MAIDTEDSFTKYYKSVYGRDNTPSKSYGWIQWKGTRICIDLHCKCGHHGHIDGDFFYHYECPVCHTKYAVGQNVKLIELSKEEIELGRLRESSFTKEEL